jgi:hypothetical protein
LFDESGAHCQFTPIMRLAAEGQNRKEDDMAPALVVGVQPRNNVPIEIEGRPISMKVTRYGTTYMVGVDIH